MWLYYIILYVAILYYQGYAETGEDPVTALLCIQRVVGEDLHPVHSLSTGRLGLLAQAMLVGATQSAVASPALAPPPQQLMGDVGRGHASLSQLDAALGDR